MYRIPIGINNDEKYLDGLTHQNDNQIRKKANE
jgi:hypothetical protein